MTALQWRGVMPAVTTPFDERGEVDHAFLARHVDVLVAAGAAAIVPCGSLGEGATLDREERAAVVATCVEAAGARVPVVPGIAAASTREAAAQARDAERLGCRGLMVLPPYVHRGDDAEMIAHVEAVLVATELECMLYNNPAAYGVDFRPEQVARLADRHRNLAAVKDSSGDVRRITAMRALMGERLALFVGLDDAVVEGVRAGAVGWVAGLVNALPEESVRLFDLAAAERSGARGCDALYAWFLPLLRLDCVPKFVQLIKLVQQEVGLGSERVRPPRRVLEGREREEALALVRERLARRPGA